MRRRPGPGRWKQPALSTLSANDFRDVAERHAWFRTRVIDGARFLFTTYFEKSWLKAV